jgi:DNA-binding XRE family transcriptional regulator
MAQVMEKSEQEDPIAVQLFLSFAKLAPSKKRRVNTLISLLDKSDDLDEQREIALAIAEILMPKLAGINDALGTVADLEEGIKPDVKEAAQAYRKKIGQAIRQKREALGLTQEQLAEKAGLLQSHISRLEIGMHAPTKNTIDRLAQALGVRPGELDLLDSD